MSYKYREVKCPWCDHVFMWQKNSQERLIIYEYRRKTTGGYIEKAKCPKCGMDMLVSDDSFVGLEMNDEQIEIIGVRGI